MRFFGNKTSDEVQIKFTIWWLIQFGFSKLDLPLIFSLFFIYSFVRCHRSLWKSNAQVMKWNVTYHFRHFDYLWTMRHDTRANAFSIYIICILCRHFIPYDGEFVIVGDAVDKRDGISVSMSLMLIFRLFFTPYLWDSGISRLSVYF